VAISKTAEPVLRKLGCREVQHIPPGVDLKDFDGGDREAARAELSLGDRVWVTYAGNPDSYQDLDVLVDAVAQDDELGLLMISASELDIVEKQALGIPEERKRFIRAETWEKTRFLLSAGDIAALPRSVCTGYPIKLLNYLGLGLPVVCAEGSAQPSRGTVTVPNRDVDTMWRALRQLASNESERLQLGREGRAWVVESCSWDARAVELEALYEKIMTGESDRRPRSLG
jgi:glycosyltransferase involved in cell wall biosynthesis